MPEMLSHLAAGRHIVCDRYIFSVVAYTAMKVTVDFEWCKSVDVGLPRPDMVMFLDISPEAAAKEGEYGEERYEKESQMQSLLHPLNALHSVEACLC
ncbi:thymidylate kinase, putative [Perkinsus marinus ATCC 50983]|uniref:Thymidylate kinase, putative n=1 Tax=Perkinsus marinus (strain ATCC 50983 / TXsc) TaxID=423536 RepID=C5KHY8_PERM5|nr:thymidylate kinase, putative [Perkinsus marinus ATCC 50983]EER16200.1 thymidylate kinase, putative [Perkinsus marinus ATCC 50983]|eukprot:XP_002784404.1 thymidylate kinase, putative [Perkinsus marinus ATCC 50983]